MKLKSKETEVVSVFYTIWDKAVNSILVNLPRLYWGGSDFFRDNDTSVIESSARFETFEEACYWRNEIHSIFLKDFLEDQLDFKVIKVEEEIKTQKVVDWKEQ